MKCDIGTSRDPVYRAGVPAATGMARAAPTARSRAIRVLTPAGAAWEPGTWLRRVGSGPARGVPP